MKKRIIGLVLAAICLCLAACAEADPPPSTTAPIVTTAPTQAPDPPQDPDPVPQVRILNTDPDSQQTWENLAEEYTLATGIEAIIVTDAQNATLLSVSSPEELPQQCVDLSTSNACTQLMSQELTLHDNQGSVLAVANQIEVYGLVYNSTLLAQTAHTRDDIRNLSNLTEVVYAITDNSESLGFSAFARVDADAHFALQLTAMEGDPRNLVELILNNTTCDPMSITDGTKTEALEDFLEGRAVFFLAGSGDQEALATIGTENIGVLPVYTGLENEENQTLAVAARSYWCVDASAEPEDIDATLAFLDFLTSPRDDGTVPVDDLRQMSPFRHANYVSNIPQQVLRSDVALGRVPTVCPYFEQAPNGLTEALMAYAADPSDDHWSQIRSFLS